MEYKLIYKEHKTNPANQKGENYRIELYAPDNDLQMPYITKEIHQNYNGEEDPDENFGLVIRHNQAGAIRQTIQIFDTYQFPVNK